MPIHAIDHIELYVGNAAQAAYYLTRAFGFAETAYSGLETGRRDRVSHVLEQGRVRFVVTGTLKGGDEIARHHARHGDGVHKIALGVPDADFAYRHAVEHGARGVRTPHWAEDDQGRVRLSSSRPTVTPSTCSSSAMATPARSYPVTSPGHGRRGTRTSCC